MWCSKCRCQAPRADFLRPNPKRHDAALKLYRTCNSCAHQRKRRRNANAPCHPRKLLRTQAALRAATCKVVDGGATVVGGAAVGQEKVGGGCECGCGGKDGPDARTQIDQDRIVRQCSLQQSKCVYCAEHLTVRSVSGLFEDRRGTQQGHVVSNVVWSCWRCAQLREDDYDFEEFCRICF